MPPNKRAKKQPVTQQYIKKLKGSDHQKLISKFHQLNKKKSDLENEFKVVKNQKSDRIRVKKEIDSIQSELDSMGGLIIYQKASQIGEKRFNSSKWLMQELTSTIKKLNQIKDTKCNLLDVGALGENYVKYKNLVNVKAIDLHSTCSFVETCDFFDLPYPPKKNDPLYEIIALSLVVNFVGDPIKRGEMIYRTFDMIKDPIEVKNEDGTTQLIGGYMYLVLPLPCVKNSRYMTNDHLIDILQQIGYNILKTHYSTKLAFYLCQKNLNIDRKKLTKKFPKQTIEDGPDTFIVYNLYRINQMIINQ